MPKIAVWTDPETGEIDEGQEHVRHFRATKSRTHVPFDKLAILKDAQSTINRMRTSCRNEGDIVKFITENWKTFCYRGYTPRKEGEVVPNAPVLMTVSLIFRKFTMFLDPVPAGAKPSKPTGSLGYEGKLVINVKEDDTAFFMRDMFKDTGITLGDGRQGFTSTYDVILLLRDWPGLDDQATLDRLTGGVNMLVDDYYAGN